jgi:hypothetical protein
VAVRVDEAGHNPLPGRVDHIDIPAVLELHFGRQRAHASDAVAFDDDGIVAYGLLAGAVDQGAIADHQGLLACGTHEDPPRGLFRTNVTAKPVQFSTAISASPAPEFVAPYECQRHPGLPAYRFAHAGYWAARLALAKAEITTAGVVSPYRISLIFRAGEE